MGQSLPRCREWSKFRSRLTKMKRQTAPQTCTPVFTLMACSPPVIMCDRPRAHAHQQGMESVCEVDAAERQEITGRSHNGVVLLTHKHFLPSEVLK